MNLRQAVEFIFTNRTNKGYLYAQHVEGQITADSDAFVAECGEFLGYVQVCSSDLVQSLVDRGVNGIVDELIRQGNEVFELVR